MQERFGTSIYKGHIIHTPKLGEMEIIENGYIVVEGYRVKGVYKALPQEYKFLAVNDYGNRLIIPGFVDLHIHASQIANRGLGLDKELLDWLTVHTFKEEAKLQNLQYAEIIYREASRQMLKHGTTRAAIYGTLHRESTELLMKIISDSGMGAFVGKVSMDRNSPEYLMEDTGQALKDEEEFLKNTIGKYRRVNPIITPRFAPADSLELMKGLGVLAQKYNVPVQSHLSEDREEVYFVKTQYPQFKNYASIYNYFGLFGQKPTIMAHCVYVTEDEINLMAQNKVFVAHCPISNFNLSGSVAPIRAFLEKDIPVGLGTDVGAGHEISIAQVIVHTIIASKNMATETNNRRSKLSKAEAFYLATKGGGSFFGKVGSFEENYEFDALIIDDSDLFNVKPLTTQERLERFIYIGKSSNIVDRYISGQKINII